MDNRSKEVVESFLLQLQKRDFDTQREMVFEFHKQLDNYYQTCYDTMFCGDDVEPFDTVAASRKTSDSARRNSTPQYGIHSIAYMRV